MGHGTFGTDEVTHQASRVELMKYQLLQIDSDGQNGDLSMKNVNVLCPCFLQLSSTATRVTIPIRNMADALICPQ